MTTHDAPPIVDLYLRLSDLRMEDLNAHGEAKGLVEHERVLRDRADAHRWTVGEVIVENDMTGGKPKPASAYKRRKVVLPDGSTAWRVIRPGFRKLLDRLRNRKSQAVLAVDLDRTVRDPRDLEDLIDIVQETGANARSLSGSLRFTDGGTDAEITLARVMVTMANKASRDTARRVSAARLRQAINGEYGGGRRPYGFCAGPPRVPDGGRSEDYPCPWHDGRDCHAGISVIPEEAAVIFDCSHRLLQGVSLAALAADLRDKNVPTVTGAPWSAETLRDVLLRPRNAGFVVHQDKILPGVVAPWDAIVEPEVFEAVVAKLTDPARRTGPGSAPRWQGSGVYRCGVCTPPGTETDKPVTCEVTLGGRTPRYRCKEHNHLSRNAEHTDDWVSLHVLYALTHERNYELLAPTGPEIDAPALRAERAAIKETLKRYARDEVLGKRTPEQVTAATLAGTERITEIDQMLNANVTDDPLADLINAADPVQAWQDTPVGSKRILIDRLMTVTILPIGRGGRGFGRCNRAAMVWRCSSVGSGHASTFAVTSAISASSRSIARSAAVRGLSPGRGCAIAASRARRAAARSAPPGVPVGVVGVVVPDWLGQALLSSGVLVSRAAAPARTGALPCGVIAVVGSVGGSAPLSVPRRSPVG